MNSSQTISHGSCGISGRVICEEVKFHPAHDSLLLEYLEFHLEGQKNKSSSKVFPQREKERERTPSRIKMYSSLWNVNFK